MMVRNTAQKSDGDRGFTVYREGGQELAENYKDFSSKLVYYESTGHSRFEPIPTSEFLDDYYNGGFSGGGNDVYNLEAQFTPSVVDVARGVLAHMRSVSPLPDEFVFHDFGCAFGALVYGFQQIGAKASGNEPNKAWVEAGNAYCNGRLTDLDLPQALDQLGSKVDLFTALHVIEHLPHPEVALQTLKANLAPGGLIYICVPNAASIQYLVGGRRQDPLYSFPMHLQYFTPKSMAAHLRAAGLEPIAVDTRWLHDDKNGDPYAIEKLLGVRQDMIVDMNAWKTAACANLLGGELFMLATHPENTEAVRQADLDERIEKAYQFMLERRPK